MAGVDKCGQVFIAGLELDAVIFLAVTMLGPSCPTNRIIRVPDLLANPVFIHIDTIT